MAGKAEKVSGRHWQYRVVAKKLPAAAGAGAGAGATAVALHRETQPPRFKLKGAAASSGPLEDDHAATGGAPSLAGSGYCSCRNGPPRTFTHCDSLEIMSHLALIHYWTA